MEEIPSLAFPNEEIQRSAFKFLENSLLRDLFKAELQWEDVEKELYALPPKYKTLGEAKEDIALFMAESSGILSEKLKKGEPTLLHFRQAHPDGDVQGCINSSIIALMAYFGHRLLPERLRYEGRTRISFDENLEWGYTPPPLNVDIPTFHLTFDETPQRRSTILLFERALYENPETRVLIVDAHEVGNPIPKYLLQLLSRNEKYKDRLKFVDIYFDVQELRQQTADKERLMTPEEILTQTGPCTSEIVGESCLKIVKDLKDIAGKEAKSEFDHLFHRGASNAIRENQLLGMACDGRLGTPQAMAIMEEMGEISPSLTGKKTIYVEIIAKANAALRYGGVQAAHAFQEATLLGSIMADMQYVRTGISSYKKRFYLSRDPARELSRYSKGWAYYEWPIHRAFIGYDSGGRWIKGAERKIWLNPPFAYLVFDGNEEIFTRYGRRRLGEFWRMHQYFANSIARIGKLDEAYHVAIGGVLKRGDLYLSMRQIGNLPPPIPLGQIAFKLSQQLKKIFNLSEESVIGGGHPGQAGARWLNAEKYLPSFSLPQFLDSHLQKILRSY